jgi:uncharacterized membrane protein YvbJ
VWKDNVIEQGGIPIWWKKSFIWIALILLIISTIAIGFIDIRAFQKSKDRVHWVDKNNEAAISNDMDEWKGSADMINQIDNDLANIYLANSFFSGLWSIGIIGTFIGIIFHLKGFSEQKITSDMVRFCGNCGKKTMSDDLFCQHCGDEFDSTNIHDSTD